MAEDGSMKSWVKTTTVMLSMAMTIPITSTTAVIKIPAITTAVTADDITATKTIAAILTMITTAANKVHDNDL